MHISATFLGLAAASFGALASPGIAERGVCLNPQCSKTVTATAHSTTTTTLAPASTAYVTTTSTTTATTTTTTTVGATCTPISGVVGLFYAVNDTLVGYLSSTSPYNSIVGVTASTAIQVSVDWIAGSSDTHHQIATIGQSLPYFGITSLSGGIQPGANGGHGNPGPVADTSSASSLPVIGSNGAAYESNTWYFSEFTTPGGIVRKAFAASWTDSTGTHSGVSWYDGRDGTTYMTRDVDANMADTGAPAYLAIV